MVASAYACDSVAGVEAICYVVDGGGGGGGAVLLGTWSDVVFLSLEPGNSRRRLHCVIHLKNSSCKKDKIMCAVALSSERYVLAFGKVKDPLSLEIALQYDEV